MILQVALCCVWGPLTLAAGYEQGEFNWLQHTGLRISDSVDHGYVEARQESNIESADAYLLVWGPVVWGDSKWVFFSNNPFHFRGCQESNHRAPNQRLL